MGQLYNAKSVRKKSPKTCYHLCYTSIPRVVFAACVFVRTCGTRWKFTGQQVGNALEVVVAGVAKVRGAKAKEHGHRAAVTALVLQQIGAVFGAHLSTGHVAASATHQFRGIIVGPAHVQFAPRFAAVVGL